MNLKDVTFRKFKGSGPGGQHKNKTENGCEAIHIPTGLMVRVDGRKYHQNKKKAARLLEGKVKGEELAQQHEKKAQERLEKIRNGKTVRTYNFKRQKVKDHRSGKEAGLNKMLQGLVPLHWFSEE